MCPPGPGAFLRVFLDRPKLFFPFQSFLSTYNHIPTYHTPPDTYHGSRYASSDLHHEGLAEGALALFPEHRFCGCEVLLLQDPGTARPFLAPRWLPAISTLSIDRVTRPQTLKERFAELLPEKIEQVKALRK